MITGLTIDSSFPSSRWTTIKTDVNWDHSNFTTMRLWNNAGTVWVDRDDHLSGRFLKRVRLSLKTRNFQSLSNPETFWIRRKCSTMSPLKPSSKSAAEGMWGLAWVTFQRDQNNSLSGGPAEKSMKTNESIPIIETYRRLDPSPVHTLSHGQSRWSRDGNSIRHLQSHHQHQWGRRFRGNMDVSGYYHCHDGSTHPRWRVHAYAKS